MFRDKLRSILSGKMDEIEFNKAIEALVDDMLLMSTDMNNSFTLMAK